MNLLHQRATPHALRLVTVTVFGLWFLIVALDPIQQLSLLPVSLFEPVGLLRVLPPSLGAWLPSPTFLLGLKAATLVSLALVLLNRWATPAAVGACALLTLSQSIARGFAGHMDHKQVVLLYAAYWLAVLPLADAIARKRGSAASGAVSLSGIPLVAILSTLCLTYSFVGIYRLVHGGLEVFRSGSMTFWALRNSYQVLHPSWGWGRGLLGQPVLDQALNYGFPIVTLFEVLAPLCLIWRWFRLVFLAVMVPFHFFSWMFMEVFFWHNLVLYLLLFDWSRPQQRAAA